jgi:hypothetical protein
MIDKQFIILKNGLQEEITLFMAENEKVRKGGSIR